MRLFLPAFGFRSSSQGGPFAGEAGSQPDRKPAPVDPPAPLRERYEAKCFEIPIGFGSRQQICRLRDILFPQVHDEQFENAYDFALLIPEVDPEFLDEDAALLLLSNPRVHSPRPGALLAMCGYPFGGNNAIDNETKRGHFERCCLLGTYRGVDPYLAGLHEFDISTVQYGTAVGFSGGAVFQLTKQGEVFVGAEFAGMTVLGNASMVHFIDGRFLEKVISWCGATKEVWSPHDIDR